MFNNNLFAEKTRSLEPYTPNKAPCLVRLDANESPFSVGEQILSKMKDALSNIAFDRYPDPDAEELCSAFAKVYGLCAENIVAANGSDELLSIIANSLLANGDKIITLNPDFSMYAFYGTLADMSVITVDKKQDFQVDFPLVDRKIKENRAKLVIFSNPCNPTGRMESKESIGKLMAENPDTIFVIDEAYLDFACMRNFGVLNDDRYSFLCDTDKYPNMFVIKTMSKAFGAAALRVGFAIGDRTVADAFRKVKSPYNVNSVSQALGCVLLSHPSIIAENTRLIVENADRLAEALSTLGFEIPKSHANFVFFACDFADGLFAYLCSERIFIRKFMLEGKGYLRISAGTDSENKTLVEAIKRFIAERTDKK